MTPPPSSPQKKSFFYLLQNFKFPLWSISKFYNHKRSNRRLWQFVHNSFQAKAKYFRFLSTSNQLHSVGRTVAAGFRGENES